LPEALRVEAPVASVEPVLDACQLCGRVALGQPAAHGRDRLPPGRRDADVDQDD
jgi:hypothetical protein